MWLAKDNSYKNKKQQELIFAGREEADTSKVVKTGKKEIRFFVQLAAFFALNPFLGNYFSGRIHQGSLKGVCLPVLNCYSCPAAATSCPLGSIQNMLAGQVSRISFLVMGILFFAAGLLGRWFCGWLCPFGFFQDILGRISKIKAKIPFSLTRLKYVVLVLLFLLPLLWVDEAGFASPYFCKFLCPQGTLTAGIPLLLADPGLRHLIGAMFWFKLASLGIILGASVFVNRPFCRILCPLGAFLGLFNKYALFRLSCHEEGCTSCKKCLNVCPVNLKIPEEINSPECIRCMACVKECPKTLIKWDKGTGTVSH